MTSTGVTAMAAILALMSVGGCGQTKPAPPVPTPTGAEVSSYQAAKQAIAAEVDDCMGSADVDAASAALASGTNAVIDIDSDAATKCKVAAIYIDSQSFAGVMAPSVKEGLERARGVCKSMMQSIGDSFDDITESLSASGPSQFPDAIAKARVVRNGAGEKCLAGLTLAGRTGKLEPGGAESGNGESGS